MTPPSRAAGESGSRRETQYATPSERELIITRTFDAPRALVWAAFTDPKHVPNWQTGPEGTTMPVCEIDLRPGGAWRYVWRNARGRETEATGIYREVDPPTRFVFVTDANGEEQMTTTTFAEQNGCTTVTTSMRLAPTTSLERTLQYARFGTETNYAHLDAYLDARVDAYRAS